MTIQEYQDRALKTATYGDNNTIIYTTLGLAGEAGEVSEKVKKVLRDKNGVFDIDTKHEIAKEIGDVLWYCNALAYDLGYSLETIMEINLIKLESRKARGKIQGNGDNR